MRKLFIMGASGKLVRHIAFSLIRDYELFLQCNKMCEELRKFLTLAEGGSGNLSIHLIRHDFIEEGVESLFSKLRSLTSRLDASIIIEPVFDQTSFNGMREELVKRVVYLDLVVPITLIRVLTPFMIGEPSVIVVLVDLTPLKGSRVYEGLNPSLPTVASSAALHTMIKELPNYIPRNVKVVGVALDWVKVPSKKLPPEATSVAMSVEEVARFMRELLDGASRYPSGTLIVLSRREKTA